MPRETTKPSQPPARRPRLTDVAKLCGVSAATVSRVLNQDAKFSARPEVRERILKAAASVGYAPDLTARNLIRGKTQIIGVFGSPDTHIGEGINDAVFAGIADAVRNEDYDVFFELTSHHHDGNALPGWRFDGAILIQAPQASLIEGLDRRHIPYVTVNETIGQPAASVIVDDIGGTQLAMQHLADLGHQRFAYTNTYSGYFPHYSVAERRDTIVSFCKEHNLILVPGHDQPFTDGESFLRRSVTEHNATAVICYDHHIAVGVLGASYRLGMRVPQDVSLLCYNDQFPVADVHPSITAIGVNGKDMGSTAAKLLLEIMNGTEQPAEMQPVRLPETLVVRESTAPPKND